MTPTSLRERTTARLRNSVVGLTEKFDLSSVACMSTTGGQRSAIRRTHEARVLEALRVGGAASRSELSQRVGLSRTTLSEITTQLLARGAVVVVDTDSATRRGSGRPAERLALDPASGQYLGIDFGHRRVQVAVADAACEVIADGVVRYPDGTEWEQRIRLAVDLIEKLGNGRDPGRLNLAALQAIGIGVPGPYAGASSQASRTSWQAQPAPEQVDRVFSERFGAPVVVDNNTRLAALAEASSIPGPPGDLVYVRLSDGVGGGLVISGRLAIGARGFAGELGHVTAVPDGVTCRCGKRGCLETIASVPAILSACRSTGAQVETLEDLAVATAKGDTAVDVPLRAIGSALGHVLGAAAMTVDPDEVVIGGEVVHAAPVLVEQAVATLRDEFYPTTELPTVRAGRLRDGDGALGALAAVFHQSPLLANYPEPVHKSVPQRSAR